MKKIAVTTTTFAQYSDVPLKLCKEKGYDVVLNAKKTKLGSRDFVSLTKDAIGVVAGTELINDETLSKLPNLKVISRCGAGIDNIDLEAAKKRNILVFNTSDAPTLAVAELTVGLILNLLRKISLMHRELTEAKWIKRMGLLLSGKKVGIVGFGKIGRKVSELLKKMGCEVAYTDICAKETTDFKCLPLGKLLSWADIISVHTSGKKKIIGKNEFSMMKRDSIFINTSRGAAVDETSLLESLKAGKLQGACLDVFEEEPYKGPLRGLDNVILTPHIGSYAKEARIEMEKQAVINLLNGLKKGE